MGDAWGGPSAWAAQRGLSNPWCQGWPGHSLRCGRQAAGGPGTDVGSAVCGPNSMLGVQAAARILHGSTQPLSLPQPPHTPVAPGCPLPPRRCPPPRAAGLRRAARRHPQPRGQRPAPPGAAGAPPSPRGSSSGRGAIGAAAPRGGGRRQAVRQEAGGAAGCMLRCAPGERPAAEACLPGDGREIRVTQPCRAACEQLAQDSPAMLPLGPTHKPAPPRTCSGVAPAVASCGSARR